MMKNMICGKIYSVFCVIIVVNRYWYICGEGGRREGENKREREKKKKKCMK